MLLFAGVHWLTTLLTLLNCQEWSLCFVFFYRDIYFRLLLSNMFLAKECCYRFVHLVSIPYFTLKKKEKKTPQHEHWQNTSDSLTISDEITPDKWMMLLRGKYGVELCSLWDPTAFNMWHNNTFKWLNCGWQVKTYNSQAYSFMR